MKLDKGYWSIADFFFGVPNFNNDIKYNPERQSQLLGGLQPLADFAKFISDTNKPYKTSSYMIRDLIQPLFSLSLIFGGFFYAVLAPLLFVGLSIGKAVGLTDKKPSIGQTLSWMTVGVLSMVTGVVKLAATPLAWLRIPFRYALTRLRKDRVIPLEERPSVTKLLDSARENPSINNVADICFELHRKYENAISRNDVTHIERQVENDAFEKIDKKFGRARIEPTIFRCCAYLNLFKEDRRSSEVLADESEPLLSRKYSHKRS